LLLQATFEDNMKDEAIARNHNTTKEAIAVGTSGGAYRIILTHFTNPGTNPCLAIPLKDVYVS
jgi:ribonuclease Z